MAIDGDLDELLRRSGAGDPVALERLLRRIDARVLHLAHRLLCDEEDARDVRQWVLWKVARSIASYGGDAAFSTWLHRIVVNACRDRQRERAADRRASEIVKAGIREQVSPAPSQGAELGELGSRVQAAVAALPQDEREVVVLRHYEGLGFPRISEVLGVAETTLKSRFQRALTRLAHSIPVPEGRRVGGG